LRCSKVKCVHAHGRPRRVIKPWLFAEIKVRRGRSSVALSAFRSKLASLMAGCAALIKPWLFTETQV